MSIIDAIISKVVQTVKNDAFKYKFTFRNKKWIYDLGYSTKFQILAVRIIGYLCQ